MSKTLITFLLDRSGSMSRGINSTIEAFNGYVDGLRGDGTDGLTVDIDMTLIQFDSNSLEKTWHDAPLDKVPRLTLENYKPRGGTPLIEAATKTIQALEKKIALRDDQPKVVVCIQTDGDENDSSPEYTWDSLKKLVKEKQEAGWEFVFMGAGIDAYQQSAAMGLSAASTVSYDREDVAATRSAFAFTAMNSRMYSAGARSDVSYTTAQKAASGDAFDPTIRSSSSTIRSSSIRTSSPAVSANPVNTLRVLHQKSKREIDLGGGENELTL